MYKKVGQFFLFFIAILTVQVYADYADPTIPLNYVDTKKKEATITLQAIFNRAGNMGAIVDGKAVKIGDSVSGVKIVSIHNKYVIYIKNGKKVQLPLRKSIIAHGGKYNE